MIPSNLFSNFCKQLRSTSQHLPVVFSISVGIYDFFFSSIVLEEDDEEDEVSAIVFVTVTLFVIVGLNCEEWSFLLYEALM